MENPRLASWIRGVFIAVLIVVYGRLVGQPQASQAGLILIGVGFQVLVILLRRFVPAARGSNAQYAFELIADGVTVLTFALGVFGTIMRMPDDI